MRKGLWSRSGTVIVVIATVVGLATSVSLLGEQEAIRQLEGQAALRSVQAEAYHVSAIEWQAIDLGRVTPGSLNQLSGAVSQVRAGLRDAQSDGVSAAGLRSVRSAVTAYLAAVDAEFAALRVGNVPRARAIDRERTDPAFERLRAAAGSSVGVAAARAAEAAGAARVATIGVFLLATVVVAVLVRLSGRAQARSMAAGARADTLAVVAGERRRLLARITEATEEERGRIAAELHDGPIQRLTRFDYTLERARIALAAGDLAVAGRASVTVQRELRGEVQALRDLMSGLLPPVLTERGVADAIRDYASPLCGAHGVDLRIHSGFEERLEPGAELALYRVAQESLTNVVKHAPGAVAKVSLVFADGSVRLAVVDECRNPGAAADRTPLSGTGGGHGIQGMRERILLLGGRVEAGPTEHGWRVHAEVPV